MGLNRDAAAAWVHALESGKYQQGQGLLRDGDDQFCCLGVACDIVRDHLGDWEVYPAVGVKPTWAFAARENKTWAVSQSRSDLPSVVREHYGLSNERQHELIALNDNGAPFSAIAALVRTWINQDTLALQRDGSN